MQTTLETPDLTNTQFDRIKTLLHSICGIELQNGKQGLVRSRLQKRLRTLHLPNFDAYIDHVKQNNHELLTMIDALTTNKTSFFREENHFDFVKKNVLQNKTFTDLRFWSAACSSGEEPYSLAMTIRETLSPQACQKTKILATDICSTVLTQARNGVYAPQIAETIPGYLRHKYFKTVGKAPTQTYQAQPSLQSLVKFGRLNFMDRWPMKGLFDVIFCRNVMIYFNKETREQLVKRFYNQLKPGGYLLIGHSESLTGIAGQFNYVQPATYIK